MSRWFRFYSDAMRNPKVAKLTDKEFRLWVELLAVAAENGGTIPCLNDLKHLLKRRLDHLSTGVERLLSIGLIDRLGDGYEPHHWSKFQYKSDTSTDRVHKHRAKRNVSETPPDTETDTDSSVTKVTAVDPAKVLWDSAKAYIGPSKASLIGKWCAEYGNPVVSSAITTAMLASPQPPDRVAYVIGILKRSKAQAEEIPIA